MNRHTEAGSERGRFRDGGTGPAHDSLRMCAFSRPVGVCVRPSRPTAMDDYAI